MLTAYVYSREESVSTHKTYTQTHRITHVRPEVGKVQPPRPAIIGYGNEGVEVKMYEVLLGSSQGVRWVPAYGRLDVQGLSARPVEGGREADGTPLYVARAHTQKHSGLFGSSGEDGIIPGKVSPEHGGAMVVSGDKEVEVKVCYLVYIVLTSELIKTCRSTKFFATHKVLHGFMNDEKHIY